MPNRIDLRRQQGRITIPLAVRLFLGMALLIALAIGVSQHCSGCIGFHVKALLKLGATRAELEEMLAVSVYMGGGPSLMYAAEALKAWDTMAEAHTA